MFGMDFEALVLIAILAFILFGPEKLPEYAAKFGYYLAKLRQASSELTQQAQASFPDLVNAPGRPPTLTPPAAAAAQTGINEHPCPSCAHLVGDDFQFCPRCGQRLKEEAGPVETPTHPLAS